MGRFSLRSLTLNVPPLSTRMPWLVVFVLYDAVLQLIIGCNQLQINHGLIGLEWSIFCTSICLRVDARCWPVSAWKGKWSLTWQGALSFGIGFCFWFWIERDLCCWLLAWKSARVRRRRIAILVGLWGVCLIGEGYIIWSCHVMWLYLFHRSQITTYYESNNPKTFILRHKVCVDW